MENDEKKLALAIDKAMEYLRRDFENHQKELRELQEMQGGESADIISFDELMPMYTELDDKAWELQTGPEKDEIVRKLNHYEAHYGGPYHNDEGIVGDRVLLSDQNMEELFGLVRESLETNGFGGIPMDVSSNGLVKVALLNLSNSPTVKEDPEKNNKLKKYLNYIGLGDSVGQTNEGRFYRFSTGYFDDLIQIYTGPKPKTVFLMKKDGTVTIDSENPERTPLEQREEELSGLEAEREKIDDIEKTFSKLQENEADK